MNDSLDDGVDPGELARLRDAVARLPQEADPPPGAWNAIRQRIEAQRVRPIAPGGPGGPGGPDADARVATATAPKRRRTSWVVIGMAAALVLAVALPTTSRRSKAKARVSDSLATAPVVVDPIPPPPEPALQPAPQGGSPARAGATVPVTLASANPTLAAVLDQYQQAARDLESEVAQRTNTLSPETREVVRRSIATIDTALADLRAALRGDPRDASTGRALSLVYERKLDFLRRVRALPAAGM